MISLAFNLGEDSGRGTLLPRSNSAEGVSPMEVKKAWSLVGKPPGAAPFFGVDAPTEGSNFL